MGGGGRVFCFLFSGGIQVSATLTRLIRDDKFLDDSWSANVFCKMIGHQELQKHATVYKHKHLT